jgi:hypothetical protein
MGSNFGDFDNDGWLDIYLATGGPDLRHLVPNRAYRNDGGTQFQDITFSGGFGHLQKGHGVAFADIDNDGDQDMFVVLGGAIKSDVFHKILLENPGHGNHWLTLQLEGTKSNRAALHARIKVVVRTENGLREIHRVVTAGSSFGGSSFRQHIGLGKATAIEALEIRWPSSATTSEAIHGVDLDRAYHIIEGTSTAEPMHLKPFHLSSNAT